MTAAAAPSPAAVMQLDGTAAAAGSDPLGLWQWPAIPATAAGFSVAAPVGAVWRVCLPADAAAANKLLTRAEMRLAETQAALVTIEHPLRVFVARHAAAPFVSPKKAGTDCELELGQLLAEARAGAACPGQAGFAPGCVSGLWEQVVNEASAFMARLGQVTADPSRVETVREEQILAATELGWRGANTVWRTPADTGQFTAHERAVGLALASRLALIRTFITATEASVLLAALFTPGGAPLAFPAALRFVARGLAEARGTDSAR